MKTNSQKSLIISVIMWLVVLIVIGTVLYFLKNGNMRSYSHKDVRVEMNYEVLKDESIWRARLIKGDTPMQWNQWNIVEKNILVKETRQNKFSCGNIKAQFIKYYSYSNGLIGDWNNISVIDCGDYYFIYEFGDPGPQLFGPFSKEVNPNLISR